MFPLELAFWVTEFSSSFLNSGAGVILCGYLRKAQGREARPLLLRVLISSLARLPKRSAHIEIIDKALKNRFLQEGTGVVSMHSVIEWIEKEVVVHKGGKHGGLFSCSDDEKLCWLQEGTGV